MASAAVVQQGGQDLSSLLSQVKVLESDRERLARELEEARRKIEDVSALSSWVAVLAAFSETGRAIKARASLMA